MNIIKKEKKLKNNAFVNIFPIFFKKRQSINILSICVYRIENKYAKTPMNKYILINKKQHFVKMLLKKGLKFFKSKSFTYYINIYNVTIEMSFIKTCPIQNQIRILFEQNEEIINMPIKYNGLYLGHSSRIYNIQDTDNMVCYIRKVGKNYTNLVVRNRNITDSFKKRFMLFFAWLFSKVIGTTKKILLYEKQCNKYEESASILYEKLIDNGYKNVYYIINKDSPHVQFIKDKYKKNIIWAHTFKHYLNFFRCKKFIGTEAIVHVIELRTINTLVVRKLRTKKFKYIFLQHGVTYMISLAANFRKNFRKGVEMPLDSKIVVSSKAEADHFVECGGFSYKDIYITGLPSYDRNTKKENADKITIMPTWRPWEYNILTANYKQSKYYKMLIELYKNVPEKLKDKVILLPHPLIIDKFRNTPLGKYIPEIISYDLILEDTALLITDYSSISYSAFYRGANVIFVWNEKDECMQHYQGNLVLNEESAFGDCIYEYSQLKDVINNNYLKEQKNKFKEKYSKIVEFHDNNNTQRLMDLLIKDKFLI